MSQAIGYLKWCPLFRHLTADESRRLAVRAEVGTFRPREYVYAPSDPGRTVLLLAQGRVKVKWMTPDGRESILAFVGAGDLFGEAALFDPAPRGEYAEAVEASLVVALPREEVRRLMERRPDVALHAAELFGLRLRRLENRLRTVLARSTRARAVAALLELLEDHGQQVGGGWEIRLRLSHQELADLIGATRESVTLALGRLRREGLVEVRRRRIHVPDRGRLSAEAAAV